MAEAVAANPIVIYRTIIETVMNCVITVYLLVQIISRYMSLAYIAANKPPLKTRSLRIRTTFSIIQLLILAGIFILTLFNLDNPRYLYGDPAKGIRVALLLISLVLLVLVYIAQIMLLNHEFNKNVPQLWYIHKLVWGFAGLTNLLYLVSTCIFFAETVSPPPSLILIVIGIR